MYAITFLNTGTEVVVIMSKKIDIVTKPLISNNLTRYSLYNVRSYFLTTGAEVVVIMS